MTSHAAHLPTPVRPLRRDDPVPLYSRIRDEIRGRIAIGQWRAHQQIPSEAALMQQYGVSRITVRQAVQALEQQGLIVKVPGKGSFVAPPKPYQELTQLQGFAEAMSRQGHVAINRVVDVITQPAPALVAQRLALAEGSQVTRIRRVRLLDGQAVSLDLTWLPQSVGDQLRHEDLVHRDIFLILENDCRIPLGHADLAMDAVTADAELAHHLGLAVGDAVLRVDRLTHTREGHPIDYETLYCRGDHFQYRLRVHRGAGDHA
ncbi:MAG: GntR family transcriptional regulator [Rubrivivax sp.]|nr:MAG: GntR family transcriptional regulator [Rubrivivax sp.]